METDGPPWEKDGMKQPVVMADASVCTFQDQAVVQCNVVLWAELLVPVVDPPYAQAV